MKQGPLEQKAVVLLTLPALSGCPVINIYTNDSATFSVLSRNNLPELSTVQTDLNVVYRRSVYSITIEGGRHVQLRDFLTFYAACNGSSLQTIQENL
jgi:hypothetical protein